MLAHHPPLPLKETLRCGCSQCGEHVRAIGEVIRGARDWLAEHPSINKVELELTLEERLRCGCPAGTRIIGTRLSNGGTVWTLSSPLKQIPDPQPANR